MENILCICNTYSQLILAVQLKNTIKKKDNVVVLLTDHSRSASDVVQNIQKEDYFYDIDYIQTNKFDRGNRPVWRALYNAYLSTKGELPIYSRVIGDMTFDELVYFNLNITTENIFAKLYEGNEAIICSRYEEGILSYDNQIHEGGMVHDSFRLKFAYFLRRLAGKRNPSDSISNFYCFYPNLYHGNAVPVRVPLITDNTCRDILSMAFGINAESLTYRQKYIYFASVGDFEGEHPVGEVKMAVRIAQLVGKDNLMVKVHPRDCTGAFEKAGLIVDRNSAIPWEVIQLNYDFSNYVFLTISSNSVFGVNTMIKDRAQVVFLYKLCNVQGNSLIQESVKAISELMNRDTGMDINGYSVAESLEDICI